MAQGRTVLRGSWLLARTQVGLALLALLVAVVSLVVIWPYDDALLAQLHFMRGPTEETARDIAWYLGTFGDYPTYNVPLALAIWVYGVKTKSVRWRRAAVVCFLGATLAGMFDDCFRLTLGRPRPDTHFGAQVPDGFYGLGYAFRGGYQSFPSGHAASVFGAAMALLVTEFPLGLVTTAFAFAVIWARMELYRHYPSDIVVGSIIGIYLGLLTGYGAKVRRVPLRPLDRGRVSP